MFAVYCTTPSATDPLDAVEIGERPEPQPRAGWTTVSMRAASLNMRDINTLRGMGGAECIYPMIIGNDGAGVLADGTEVIVHASVSAPGWVGPEVLDPDRTVLSAKHQGTFAGTVAVPLRNAVVKPPELTFEEAACLPTAWLTAYRMAFVTAAVRPGQRVAVHGRRRLGSIATALISLVSTAGVQVHVVGEDSDRELALSCGAHAFHTRPDDLPGGLDAAFDAGVRGHDWIWPISRLRPGGTIVCAGYRVDPGSAPADASTLQDLIFSEIRLLGSSMGSAEDLAALAAFLVQTGLRPRIAQVHAIDQVRRGMSAMLTAAVSGKIVFRFAGVR